MLGRVHMRVISEIGEHIHQKLVRKKIIKERNWNPNIRFAFWAVFLIATVINGFLVSSPL